MVILHGTLVAGRVNSQQSAERRMEIRNVCRGLLCMGLMAINTSPASCDVDPVLLCSAGFCSDQVCPEPPEHCTAQNETHNGIWMPSQTFCNCCDFCLVYLAKGEICTQGNLGAPPAGSACGPGLTCLPTEGEDYSTCQRMVTECHILQNDYDERRENGTLGSMEERPGCDEEGKFGVKSCVPGQTCFCLAKDGSRIFGEIVNEKSAGINMHCGCSRDAHEAENLLGPTAMPRRCTSDGGYDPLQCSGNRCFCVKPDTGVLASTIVVDLQTQSLTGLPCFDSTMHHSNRSYYRECEEEKLEMLKEMKAAEDEGYSYLGNPLPSCQADGYFSRIIIRNQTKYCVNERGKQIQDFEADLSDPLSKSMDCNCARTYELLKKASSAFLPSCCRTGNWRPVQCRRGFCYCVDSNGAQQGAEVEMEAVDRLKCYTEDWTKC